MSEELWAIRLRGLQESFRAILQTSRLECAIVQVVSDDGIDIRCEVERILKNRKRECGFDNVCWTKGLLEPDANRWVFRATILMTASPDESHDPALPLIEQGNEILKRASGALGKLVANPLTDHTPLPLWQLSTDQRWLWLLFELAWRLPELGIAAEQSLFPPIGHGLHGMRSWLDKKKRQRPAWLDKRPCSFDCTITSVAAASVAAIDGLFHLSEATEKLNTAENPRSTNATPDPWPADESWSFREGEAAFRGRTFQIDGAPWRLLNTLAKKPGSPVRKSVLLDAINVDPRTGIDVGNADDGTLRSHLTRTRRILQSAFWMSKSVDPLPWVDRGSNAAWKLDETVFPSVAEIQRRLNGH